MTCVGTEQLRTGNIRREDMGEKIKNMFRGHKEKKKNQNGKDHSMVVLERQERAR